MKKIFLSILFAIILASPLFAANGNGVALQDANGNAITTANPLQVKCVSGCGGGATPGGSDTQVQFNDGGSALGGNAGFVFIKASGNVGIGSINPGAILDVNGTTRTTGLTVGTAGVTLNGSGVGSFAGNQGIGFDPINTNYTTPKLYLATTGNVGLGNSSPGKTLDVTGSLRTLGITMTGNGAQNGYVLTATDSAGDTTWSATTGGLWTTQNTNDMIAINSGTYGNIGIGTNNTSNNKLTVVGGVSIGTFNAASTNGLQVLGNVSIGTGTTSSNAFTVYNPSNSNVSIGSTAASSFLMAIGTSGQTIINSSGNVGIGTSATGAPFIVSGTAVNGAAMTITGGNLGIGSLTPGQFLDVQGTTRSLGFATSTGIGTTGTGGTSCLCKTYSGGICTVIGTCT